MLLSPPNDPLFFLPLPKPLTNPPFFVFPIPISKSSRILLPIPPLCSNSPTIDTQPLPKSAILRIAQKLRSLGYVEEDNQNDTEEGFSTGGPTTPGQIFIPLPTRLPKYRVGHTLDPSWSSPENPVPVPGSGNGIKRFHELKRVVKEERVAERLKRTETEPPTLAELTLPKNELRRLRAIGIGLDKKLKIGKAGITEGIVNGIHERWRQSELVKVVCDDICKMNMKRTHDLLERKTGGLVIWRAGSKMVLYRGSDYKYPYFLAKDNIKNQTSDEVLLDRLPDSGSDGETHASSRDNNAGELKGEKTSSKVPRPPLILGVGAPNRVRFQLPGEAQLAQEADSMLEGLGPRFTDWWGYEPLPVDADLLPAVVPGYRRPFRLLPYGVQPKLTNDEMTILKRLGRPLPCHFALGRNNKLQGLAVSILKLWEKCEIAKVAIKRGVQNTRSELMAEELKNLTGGTLLSRDKEFIVLYRGKDFLPAAVSSAIEERRKHRFNSKEKGTDESSYVPIVNGKGKWTSEDSLQGENTLTENRNSDDEIQQRRRRSKEAAIEKTSLRLSEALAKKERAEKLLAELESKEISEQPQVDKEGITEEERFMLRKVGLRMKPFLLMGRRGVFAGTVENMHLHWKYRELVKIVCDARSNEELHKVARTLEAESGGILVAVERVSKGYAIIVYRGKNYTRPDCLRPQTLLSKREAMKRSLEAQRRQSLKLHVLKLTQNIDSLKFQVETDKGTSSKLLAEVSRPGLVKQHEVDKVQSAECKMPVANPEASFQAALSTSSSEQQDIPEESDTSEPEPLAEPARKDCENMSGIKEMDVSTTLAPSDSVKVYSHISSSVLGDSGPGTLGIRNAGLSADSPVTKQKLSVVRPSENKCLASSPRVARLSNKERLLLRKQALMMRRRPLFSIGKSNIAAGVAKALKAHFEKHPLAIVNVKGRAKGTSIQEVVHKLEEATGAIFVSEEPSKVILYRGWGAMEEATTRKNGRRNRNMISYSSGTEDQTRYTASPELLSAIRLEYELQFSKQKESIS